jgi:hypothetical protein
VCDPFTTRLRRVPNHLDPPPEMLLDLALLTRLAPIVATHAADPSCSHRLAVDNPGARLRVTANTRAELLTEHVVQMLPRAVQTPQSKVVVGGLPGRKLVRRQPPGAATSRDVEDGVKISRSG